MIQVNIQQAKTQLSRLVEQARAGEDIVLAKAGKPMVRLVAVTGETGTRVAGQWAGRAHIPENFDDEDMRIVQLFSGKPTARPRKR